MVVTLHDTESKREDLLPALEEIGDTEVLWTQAKGYLLKKL